MERPEPTVICKDCNNLGYFVFECDNGNGDTEFCCPLCGKTGLTDIPASNIASYCSNCKTIVSKSWCLHGHNGCSFNVYYGRWFESDRLVPIFSTLEDANEFFIKYKAKELLNVIVVCGCFGKCFEEKYQCPKAYNTGNPFNDYYEECCTLAHCNKKPVWHKNHIKLYLN